MNSSTKPHNSSDKAGILTSLICAAHCGIIPIFSASLSVIGLGVLQSGFVEAGMFALSLLFGIRSIKKSTHVNGNKTPMMIMLAGFILIIIGHTYLNSFELILVPAGGLLIAAAHFYKLKFIKP
ncbi:MerC domain-containing protein [Pedobacter aquatilis]|uniref:MerC domain-containing protein n=1 Tax=Pedobacter aquatilis TaxID=351343 RepID=UPI002931DBB6|nr:MerC domain-containing protein [Pedobacter aquatilis]